MKEIHLKILSITLPTILVLLFVLSFSQNSPTTKKESNYKLALSMHEDFPKSQASVILASDILSNKVDRTKVSYLDIFNDKFSLPQNQLSNIIDELENEHKEIIYQHHSDGIKVNKILELNPRFRIVLSTYLNIDPSILKPSDLDRKELSSLNIYLLKAFASSDDLLLLLKENRLNQSYVQINNLKRIYGNKQHNESNNREISNINEN